MQVITLFSQEKIDAYFTPQIKMERTANFFAVLDFLDHSDLQVNQIMKKKNKKKWKNAKTIDNLYLK